MLTGRRQAAQHALAESVSERASEGSDPAAARDERQTPRALRLPAAAVWRAGRGGPPAQADRPLHLDHRHVAQTQGRPTHAKLSKQISYISTVSLQFK